jgi:hypothetical protein
MRERAMRLAIAFVLTVVDIAVFNRYSSVIWQAWGRNPWARVGLFALLALWVSSAAVIWVHISKDMRATFCEQKPVFSPEPAHDPNEPRRTSNV